MSLLDKLKTWQAQQEARNLAEASDAGMPHDDPSQLQATDAVTNEVLAAANAEFEQESGQ